MGGVTNRVDSRQHDDSTPATLGEIVLVASVPATPESEWVALVRSVAARDQRALRALYERTHRIVFTLIIRITRDREAGEELMLDVFHDVWRRASEYDVAYGSVVGWVMNLARSRAIDRLRSGRRKRVDGKADDVTAPPAERSRQEAIELAEHGPAAGAGGEVKR